MSAHGSEVMYRIGRSALNVVRIFRRKHEPPAGPKLKRSLRARFRRFGVAAFLFFFFVWASSY